MTEETKEVKKTCWLAKLSMYCFIGALVSVSVLIMLNVTNSDDPLIMTAPVLLVLSILSAIASLVRMRYNKKPLNGKSVAIASIVLSFIFLVLVFLPALSGPHRENPSRVVCATNLKGLGTSIMIYASNHDDMLPEGNNWCDALILEVDADPKSFMCKNPMVVYGESSYAINKNALGKKFSEMPSDMVLVFETSLGRKDIERTDEVRNRPSFNKYPETSKIFSGKEKVYLNRWNQVGRPEDLTVDNHEGRGCNVLFGDGHVEFVKAEDIGKLRWTVE